VRYKGCLIAVAGIVAVLATVAVVVGPSVVREGRRAIAPIRKMSAAQSEFERWVRANPWKDPASPTLDERRLTTFLALRREVAKLDEQIQRRPEEQFPEGRQPSIADVPSLLEGVGGIVAQRTSAFQRAGMTPGEYAYVERLVYRTWLAPLTAKGLDPAALGRAAEEIEKAAQAERDRAVAAGLRRVATELRARPVPAPEGVPDEIHTLLTAHAREIEPLAGARLPLPRSRRGGFHVDVR
jgi:hypothetical protein